MASLGILKTQSALMDNAGYPRSWAACPRYDRWQLGTDRRYSPGVLKGCKCK